MPPYWDLGYAAAEAARPGAFALGTAGGGYGATTATLKGGVGSASAVTSGGITVGALAIVNAVGSATIGDGPHFWAAPFEQRSEFGASASPTRCPKARARPAHEGPRPALDHHRYRRGGRHPHQGRSQAPCPHGRRRPLPRHPPRARADGRRQRHRGGNAPVPLARGGIDLTEIGMVAGDCLARAIARGVYEATALPFPGALPAWRDRFAAGAASP